MMHCSIKSRHGWSIASRSYSLQCTGLPFWSRKRCCTSRPIFMNFLCCWLPSIGVCPMLLKQDRHQPQKIISTCFIPQCQHCPCPSTQNTVKIGLHQQNTSTFSHLPQNKSSVASSHMLRCRLALGTSVWVSNLHSHSIHILGTFASLMRVSLYLHLI